MKKSTAPWQPSAQELVAWMDDRRVSVELDATSNIWVVTYFPTPEGKTFYGGVTNLQALYGAIMRDTAWPRRVALPASVVRQHLRLLA